MSDIVEWLRDRAFKKTGPTMEAIHTKQQEWIWADEIERLRAENARLRAAGEGVVKWWLDDGCLPFDGAPYALFALRKALGDIRASVEKKDA